MMSPKYPSSDCRPRRSCCNLKEQGRQGTFCQIVGFNASIHKSHRKRVLLLHNDRGFEIPCSTRQQSIVPLCRCVNRAGQGFHPLGKAKKLRQVWVKGPRNEGFGIWAVYASRRGEVHGKASLFHLPVKLTYYRLSIHTLTLVLERLSSK